MKRPVLFGCPLLIVCFLSLFSPAQQFQPTAFYQVAHHSIFWGSTTADFNGDGNLDVAIADQHNSQVDIMLGVGDGTFVPGVRIPALIATGVAAGDLNGDGKADLVVARFTDPGKLSLYFGNGDGTFASAGVITAGRQPIGVVIADLNGDGSQDIAVANSNTNGTAGTISVYLNQGAGTFTAANYRATGHPWAIAVGDFDSDGHPDLVVTKDNYAGSNSNKSLTILLNNGDGSYRRLTDYTLGVEVVGVSVGDINHDGKPDLAVAVSDGFIVTLLGDGNGFFSKKRKYPETLGVAPTAVALADFNLDGNLDMAVAMLQGTSVSTELFYGKSDGTFVQPPVPIISGNYGTNSMVVGDFDHDGAMDVAIPVEQGGTLAVALNTQ